MDAKQIDALAQTIADAPAHQEADGRGRGDRRAVRSRRLQGAVRGARQDLRRRRRQDGRLEDRAHPAAPVRAAEALRPGVRLHLPERHPPERRGVRARAIRSSPASSPSWWRAWPKDAPAGAAPYTADSIRAYVANLYCGMELVDNRYVDVDQDDRPGAASPTTCCRRPASSAPRSRTGRSSTSPTSRAARCSTARSSPSAAGSAVMGSALISLAWLANTLNKHGTDAEGRRPHPHRLGPSAGVPARHRAWRGRSSRGWAGRRSRSARTSGVCKPGNYGRAENRSGDPYPKPFQGGTASIPMPVAWALDSGRPTRGDVEDRLEERERGEKNELRRRANLGLAIALASMAVGLAGPMVALLE